MPKKEEKAAQLTQTARRGVSVHGGVGQKSEGRKEKKKEVAGLLVSLRTLFPDSLHGRKNEEGEKLRRKAGL